MTEEAAPDYRAILAARGLPAIAGGSPEGDEKPEDTPTQTPAPAAPDEGTPAEPPEGSPDDTPDAAALQKRVDDLLAGQTRAQQEAAQYRNIIDLARQGDADALQFLGYAPPDDPDTPAEDELTPEERLEAKLAEHGEILESFSKQREEAEIQEAANRFYETELEKLDPDGTWSDDYRNLVVRVGDDHLDENGYPVLKDAHEAIQAQFEADFKKRVEAKRTPQVPSGASPSEQPDLDDPKQRRDYMAARYAESQEGGLGI